MPVAAAHTEGWRMSPRYAPKASLPPGQPHGPMRGGPSHLYRPASCSTDSPTNSLRVRGAPLPSRSLACSSASLLRMLAFLRVVSLYAVNERMLAFPRVPVPVTGGAYAAWLGCAVAVVHDSHTADDAPDAPSLASSLLYNLPSSHPPPHAPVQRPQVVGHREAAPAPREQVVRLEAAQRAAGGSVDAHHVACRGGRPWGQTY